MADTESSDKNRQQKRPLESVLVFVTTSTFLVVTFLVPLYTAFVTQNLWNWFVAEAFHATSISYWQALGVVMLVNLLMYRSTHAVDEEKLEKRWKQTLAVVELCVPDENLPFVEAAKEAQEPNRGPLRVVEIFMRPLGEPVAGTFVLAIGWLVHTFLV